MPPFLAGEVHAEDVEVVDGVFAEGDPAATFAAGSDNRAPACDFFADGASVPLRCAGRILQP